MNNMTMLTHPRSPSYDGTETGVWQNVDKTFHAFVKAYYKRNNVKSPELFPKSFHECSGTVRQWISNHSLLGSADATEFSDGVILPVVNPDTGNLNKQALISAKAMASKVSGITDELVKEVQSKVDTLIEKEFSNQGNESYEVDLLGTFFDK